MTLEVDFDFNYLTKTVRKYMYDAGVKICEQNHRYFAKATSFPCVLLSDRTFGDLGRFKISVVAETKKRLSKGLVGISSLKISPASSDPEVKWYHVFHFEGSDQGDSVVYVYSVYFLEIYAQHRFGCSMVDVDVDRLLRSLIKETYWGNRGHGMYGEGEISQPVDDVLLMGKPSYRCTMVTKEGVCYGFEAKEQNVVLYYNYKSLSEAEEYTSDVLEVVHRYMDNMERRYDENPLLYSPMASMMKTTFLPHKLN